MLFYLIILPAAILAFYILKAVSMKFFTLPQIKGPAAESIYFGHLKQYALKGNSILKEWKNQFGPVFKIFLGMNSPTLVVSDPKLVMKVLNDLDSFPVRGKPPGMRNRLPNLIFGDLNVWRKLRRATQPVFAPSELNKLSPLINNKIANLVEILHASPNGSKINLLNYSSQTMMDVIGSAAFGVEMNCMKGESSQVLSIIRKLLLPTPSFLRVFFSFVPIMEYFTFLPNVQARKDLFQVSSKLVEARRGDQEKEAKMDFLTLMLNAKDKETGDTLTNEEIVNNSNTFLVAGHETTATSLAVTIWYLAQNPRVTAKLIEEIDRLNDGNDLEFSSIEKYEYTSWVINEGLRLKAAVPGTSRVSVTDIQLGDHHIPAGTNILVPTSMMQTDEEYWGENANEFYPERWGETNEAALFAQKYCFLPFGGGRRKCIGYKFALQELHYAIIKLYRNFSFERDFDSAESLQSTIGFVTILLPNGTPVILRKRH